MLPFAPLALALASRLHARNRHAAGYDLQRLAHDYPPLSQHVIEGRGARALSIDFARPASVEALNAALLTVDYGVREFALPTGQLCPAVPGRADYLHIVADLLAADNSGDIPRGRAIRGLDVGVGAACIYPLLGHAEYGWSFVGSDVDDASLASAAAIVRANDAPVELRKQASAEHVLAGVLPSEGCAFTLCNPPFYASAEEEAAAAARKWKGLRRKSGGASRSFGGREHELWCPGGEKRFVTNHIRESAQQPRAALWFTSLVSAEKNLPKLLAELEKVQPARVEQLSVTTGNKAMRVLAWSFMEDATRRERLASLVAAGGADDGAAAESRFEAARRACVSTIAAAALSLGRPSYAFADLASAGASGLPMLGRFERLKGANAFIGDWKLFCADCAGPSESGTLSFLRDGDVELRSAAGQLVGVGAEPWSYKPREKGGSVVIVSFSLDVSGSDVLYFSGAVDAEGGPERRLEGSLKTGVGRKVGDFVATVIQ